MDEEYSSESEDDITKKGDDDDEEIYDSDRDGGDSVDDDDYVDGDLDCLSVIDLNCGDEEDSNSESTASDAQSENESAEEDGDGLHDFNGGNSESEGGDSSDRDGIDDGDESNGDDEDSKSTDWDNRWETTRTNTDTAGTGAFHSFVVAPNPRLRTRNIHSDSESESDPETESDAEEERGEENESDVESDIAQSERIKASQTKKELQKLTVKQLKDQLRGLEMKVTGKKAELIDRLLSRGKDTGIGIKGWQKSKARLLLVELFGDDKSNVHSMSDEEVYNSHPWFQNYSYKKFEKYLSVIKEAAENLRDVVSNDEQEILAELAAFPRGDVTIHGYPFWDTHDASALLEVDVREGDEMMPKELWESRAQYQDFPLEVFRNHIYQAKRKMREEPGWVLKRNEKAKKLHEEDIRKNKNKWEAKENEAEIKALVEQLKI